MVQSTQNERFGRSVYLGNGQASAANEVCAEAEGRAFASALVSAVARAQIGISEAIAEAVVESRITAFARVGPILAFRNKLCF